MFIEELLKQIEILSKNENNIPALYTALAIPDIAGSIDTISGKATKEAYIKWFDTYAAEYFIDREKQLLTGINCYYLRCSVLHQAISHNEKTSYENIFFINRKRGENIMINSPIIIEEGKGLVIDIEMFCNAIVMSGYNWINNVCETDLYKENINRTMSIYILSYNV